jgi:hypothetical protein
MTLTNEEKTRRLEMLFDALPVWGTREDLVAACGEDDSVVEHTLRQIRTPEIAQAEQWTVPHVPAGRGPHLYQALLVEENAPLDADALNPVLRGAASTASRITTQGENEAFALQMAAANTDDPAKARALRRFARQLDGAAASAPEVVKVLDELLNGS